MKAGKIKIVITGGAGFIGSHVTKLFCDLGYKVTVIDDLSFGFKKLIDPRAEFVKGSIGNKPLIEKTLKGASAVLHLAASSIIKFSFEDPAGYFHNNLTNGIVLLEAMRKNKVPKIIFSSTAAVYGEPEKIPVREDDPKNPTTPYGGSKLAFEEALKVYYHSFGINSVSLRFFNAYGPNDEQKPATRAVPIWIKAVLQNKPIPLYWKGEQKRDYIFVGDIARVFKDVLGLKGCRVYNLGNGKGVWMKDIIKNIENISGKKLKIVDAGQRPGDPKFLVADISKIQKEVGWRPKTDLRAGLETTYSYFDKKV